MLRSFFLTPRFSVLLVFASIAVLALLTSCSQTEGVGAVRSVTPPTSEVETKQPPLVQKSKPFEADYQVFRGLKGHKAFAVAREAGPGGKFTWAWSIDHPSQQIAEKSAQLACLTSVRNLGRRGHCALYAVNERKLVNF